MNRPKLHLYHSFDKFCALALIEFSPNRFTVRFRGGGSKECGDEFQFGTIDRDFTSLLAANTAYNKAYSAISSLLRTLNCR